MAAFFIVAAIAGLLLALRFKVFVLVPTTLVATLAILAIGHQTIGALAVTVLGTAVLLHIGYLVGCTILFIGSARRTDAPSDHSRFNVNRAPR